MNTAPMDGWEGAEAYFTFADKPAVIGLLIVAGLAVCAFTIYRMAWHETHAAKRHG